MKEFKGYTEKDIELLKKYQESLKAEKRRKQIKLVKKKPDSRS